MTLDEYESEALRTCAVDRPYEWFREVFTYGLAEEAGEVCGLIKKRVRDGVPLDRERLREELGDVLFYVAMLGRHFGIHLSEVAEANVGKLRARYPNGFEVRS